LLDFCIKVYHGRTLMVFTKLSIPDLVYFNN